jgi:hypothetical protein
MMHTTTAGTAASWALHYRESLGIACSDIGHLPQRRLFAEALEEQRDHVHELVGLLQTRQVSDSWDYHPPRPRVLVVI